jgi:hypothetical protein
MVDTYGAMLAEGRILPDLDEIRKRLNSQSRVFNAGVEQIAKEGPVPDHVRNFGTYLQSVAESRELFCAYLAVDGASKGNGDHSADSITRDGATLNHALMLAGYSTDMLHEVKQEIRSVAARAGRRTVVR